MSGGTIVQARPNSAFAGRLLLTVEEMVSRYADRQSVDRIAASAGVSIGTVYKLLHAAGVVMRRPGRQAGDKPGPRNPARTRAMQAMRANGHTLAEIGERYGVTAVAVHYALARAA